MRDINIVNLIKPLKLISYKKRGNEFNKIKIVIRLNSKIK